jgi:hypothetical protein
LIESVLILKVLKVVILIYKIVQII